MRQQAGQLRQRLVLFLHAPAHVPKRLEQRVMPVMLLWRGMESVEVDFLVWRGAEERLHHFHRPNAIYQRVMDLAVQGKAVAAQALDDVHLPQRA